MDTNFYQQVWEQNTLKVVVGIVNGRGYKSTKTHYLRHLLGRAT